ncbi:hypothetical protein [Thiomonas sp. FB-6]|uniref:hypothetical protein n=1 Tax=Thiomonas sp. FB-6 TaxID=1158291 RepID=UPI0003607C30|nr:hypothetical protein [Thiomonas sp. FB-6]
MIRNSKQQWEVGQTVKVGFLSLVVRAKVATPGDGAPDAYVLANAAGTQLYKFVPHNGLEKISTGDARSLLATAQRHGAEMARAVVERARAHAALAGEIDALLAAC